MTGMTRCALAAALMVAAAGVWGCDKVSRAPARTHAADDAAPAGSRSIDGGYSSNARNDGYADRGGGSSGYASRSEDRRPAPQVDGVPMWSDNRRHSAEENADYHFHRDGPDFGAASVKDYVKKAHAFLEHPPADVQTVSRPNGDKLLYDAKTNTFAAERKDGAPRTMFKPHDGGAYWRKQQAKAASGDSGYGGRNARRTEGDEG